MKKRLLPSFALAALLSLGLYAIAAPAPSAHAAPAPQSALVFRSFGPAAMASFVGGYTINNQHILVEVSVSIG